MNIGFIAIGRAASLAILAGWSAMGCASNSSEWYKGPHKSEAKADLNNIPGCVKLKPVSFKNLRLTEEMVPVKYPGSFTAPDGTKVHGYCQRRSSHGYFIKSIDDARVRHHERGHVVLFENGIAGGHPSEFKKCFFLWRLRLWTPDEQPEEEIDIVDKAFDEDGKEIKDLHENPAGPSP